MAGRRTRASADDGSGRRKKRRAADADASGLADSDDDALADGTDVAVDDQLSSFAALPEADQNKLIGKLTRLLLVRNVQKLPVKREELTKALGTEYGRSAKLFPDAFRLAQSHLRQVFGFEVKEIRRTVAARGASQATQRRTQTQASLAASQGAGGAVGGKYYVLTNGLPACLRAEAPEKEAVGLMAVVAGMILLNANGRMQEDAMLRQLERLGVDEKNDVHPQLGNVRVLLDRMVKQLYFEKERVGESSVYRIGPRFRAEVDDEDLIKIVESVYGSSIETSSRNDLLMRLRGVEDEE